MATDACQPLRLTQEVCELEAGLVNIASSRPAWNSRGAAFLTDDDSKIHNNVYVRAKEICLNIMKEFGSMGS